MATANTASTTFASVRVQPSSGSKQQEQKATGEGSDTALTAFLADASPELRESLGKMMGVASVESAAPSLPPPGAESGTKTIGVLLAPEAAHVLTRVVVKVIPITKDKTEWLHLDRRNVGSCTGLGYYLPHRKDSEWIVQTDEIGQQVLMLVRRTL